MMMSDLHQFGQAVIYNKHDTLAGVAKLVLEGGRVREVVVELLNLLTF